MMVRAVRHGDGITFVQIFGFDSKQKKFRWFTMPTVDMADLPMEEQLQASLDVVEQTKQQAHRAVHTNDQSTRFVGG